MAPIIMSGMINVFIGGILVGTIHENIPICSVVSLQLEDLDTRDGSVDVAG